MGNPLINELLVGTGFKDPNSATFTPDPQVMARRSVLSAVTEYSPGRRLGTT